MQDNKAFLDMAFIGGTCLRFLYSIPRYSEDLDFSSPPDKNIEFDGLLSRIVRDLEAENYVIKIKKQKPKIVLSAFLKFPNLLYELGISPHSDETLSVKIEIDTNPPRGEVTETTLIRKYITLNILHYDKPSLFAGKLHAILTRKYTKGRDLFDLVWILSGPEWSEPNYNLLNNALSQTGWDGPEINTDNWKEIVEDHISKINWKQGSEDVLPFLEREADQYLLTLENCKSLLNKF
jgi:predicted nucleotidyltransferase component of viral defense system